METLTADGAPPQTPSRRVGVPGWLPQGTLALGCGVATLALFLPWERVSEFNSGLPGGVDTANIPVATSLVANPNYTFGYLLYAPASHQSLPQLFAGLVWHAAVPLIGVVLLLAFLSWRTRWLRLPLLAAFTLWSALLGVIGVNFLITLRDVTSGSVAQLGSHPPQRTWWTGLIAVSGIYANQTARPAWGWYALWAGLALSAVGIVWCGLRARRPVAPRAAVADRGDPAPNFASARRQRIAIVLCTLSFVVWAAALLALPVALVTCPTPTVAQAARAGACAAGSPIYAIEAEAIAPLFTTVAGTYTLASVEGVVLVYVRTLVVLALVLVAAPFALAVIWRARSTWLRAVACAVWGTLVLTVTWTAVFSALAFIRPHRTLGSDFFVSTPLDPGVGVFLVPLAALAIVAGLALRWLPVSRLDFPATPAATQT